MLVRQSQDLCKVDTRGSIPGRADATSRVEKDIQRHWVVWGLPFLHVHTSSKEDLFFTSSAPGRSREFRNRMGQCVSDFQVLESNCPELYGTRASCISKREREKLGNSSPRSCACVDDAKQLTSMFTRAISLSCICMCGQLTSVFTRTTSLSCIYMCGMCAHGRGCVGK